MCIRDRNQAFSASHQPILSSTQTGHEAPCHRRTPHRVSAVSRSCLLYTSLTEDERNWIADKEAKVKAAGADSEGGSLQPLLENSEAAEPVSYKHLSS